MKCKKCKKFENCIAKDKINDVGLCKLFIPADSKDEETAREFLVNALGPEHEAYIMIKMPGGLACDVSNLIQNIKRCENGKAKNIYR